MLQKTFSLLLPKYKVSSHEHLCHGCLNLFACHDDKESQGPHRNHDLEICEQCYSKLEVKPA